MSFGQFFKVHCVAKKVAAFLLGDVYHPAHGHFAHLPHGQDSGRFCLEALAGWKIKVCLMAVGKSS